MPREDPRVHGTRQWLARSTEDLGLAEFLVGSSAFPAGAAFHCQQAAEKSLKAFLFWHNQPFRRTHNLEELAEACLGIDPDLRPVLDRAVPLTEYAWKFLYPGQAAAPSQAEAAEAVSLARDVYSAILHRLPTEARP